MPALLQRVLLPGRGRNVIDRKNGCLGGAAADSLVMLFMSYYTRGAYGTVIKNGRRYLLHRSVRKLYL